MGTVFRCHNALAPRIRAAVKVLRHDPSEHFRDRFVREVEALERLQHPAIVRVKGWGEHDGLLWLAMDLVEGRDLASRLQDGPLDPTEAIRLFDPLAAGLAHAHGLGVFHRDIKPENILVGDDGQARLVDFGIAIHAERTRLSTRGVVPGTPAYLAPEVFGGQPSPQGLDIYALGQVLFECLTGTPAFGSPGAMTTTQRIAHVAGRKLTSEPLDPGPEHPDALRRLCTHATHPDPRHRLGDFDAFRAALAGDVLETPPNAESTLSFVFEPESEEPPPPPPPEPRVAPTPPDRAFRRLALGGVVMFGLTVGVVLTASKSLPSGTPTTDAVQVARPLAGKRLRLVHDGRTGAPVVESARKTLVDAGATVELLESPGAPVDYFGRTVYWDDRNATTAETIQHLLRGVAHATPDRRPKPKTASEFDLVIWMRP